MPIANLRFSIGRAMLAIACIAIILVKPVLFAALGVVVCTAWVMVQPAVRTRGGPA